MFGIPEKLKQIYRTNIVPLADNKADIQINIIFPALGLHIKNNQLQEDKFELTESLCSAAEITYGACESAQIKFTVADVTQDLTGQMFTVTQIINGTYTMPLGTYTVESAKKQDDLRFIDIVGYDNMRLLDVDVAAWYRALPLPMTVRDMRLSLCNQVGLEAYEQELCNDAAIVERAVEPAYLKARDVMAAIGEINGAFGHITRDNQFKFVEISLALYPAEDLYPADDLYPSGTDEVFGIDGCAPYISTKYEDYFVEEITGVQIRQESGDVGAIAGEVDNPYIIEANLLCYNKSAADLMTIAEHMLSVVRRQCYMPHNTVIIGLPYLEVGDSVNIVKNKDIIETLILKRALKGIQALTDEIAADGNQYRENSVSANTQIEQLKGRSTVIEKSVEGVKVTVSDLDKKTEAKFEITDSQIKEEIKRSTEAEGELSATITKTAEGIRQDVKKLADDTEASFEQTSSKIAAKVSKGDVSSQLSIEPDQIYLGSNRLIVDSKNFRLDSDGNAWFSGDVVGAMITGSSFVVESDVQKVIITPDMFRLISKDIVSALFAVTSENGNNASYMTATYIIVTTPDGSTTVGAGKVRTGAITCDTINDAVPITASNINTYLQGIKSDIASLKSDVAALQMPKPEGGK